MANQAEPTAEKPPPVKELPGGPWYRTLDDAIHAWAIDNRFHDEEVEVPRIRVYVRSHVGGWNVG